jgi:hypothetical protein
VANHAVWQFRRRPGVHAFRSRPDIISMHSLLFATHLAQLYDNKDSLKPVSHRLTTVQNIQSRLNQSTGSSSDELIAAVLAVAHQEVEFGEAGGTPLIHMKGAMAMICSRGGPSAIDALPLLSIYTSWVTSSMHAPRRFSDLLSLSASLNPSSPHLGLEDLHTFLTLAEPSISCTTNPT